MRLFTSIRDYIDWRNGVADHAFVPTMGALHRGHLALVQAARERHAVVSASIFVNPKQFGPGEDLTRYPRPRERDLQMLEAEGVAAVFAPDVEVLYPPGFSTDVNVTGPLTERVEGAVRPGHLRGVATVVAKLLIIARPSTAYFGQKDAQQVLVVMRMVADLHIECGIEVVPTVRELDGLALSSRNVYLGSAERRSAPVLFSSLVAIRHAFDGGERQSDMLKQTGYAHLGNEPSVQVEYLAVVSPLDLADVSRVDGGALVAIAARIGGTRLIDNILIGNGRLGRSSTS